MTPVAVLAAVYTLVETVKVNRVDLEAWRDLLTRVGA